MKTITRVIFIIILNLFQHFAVNAQDKTIDSLKLALKSANQDTTRANILYQLAETASEDEWQQFNEQLKNFAESKLRSLTPNDPQYISFRNHLAYSLCNMGVITNAQGNPREAVEYYVKSLNIYEEIGNKYGTATALNNLGFTSNNRGDVTKALEYYTRALKVLEEVGDRRGLANTLNNTGVIYNSQGEITKALEYFIKSIKIFEEIGDKKGVANSINSMGAAYIAKGEVSKALDCFNRSIKINEEIGNKKGLAYSLHNIGLIFDKQKDITKALDYFLKALKIRLEIGDKIGTAYSFNNIGGVYINQKNYSKALEYFDKGMKLGKELGYPEIIRNSAQGLTNIYKAIGNYKSASENYELYIQMRDSISNGETKKSSIKSQFKIEFERKELEAKSAQEKMDLKNEEEKQKQRIIRNSFITGFALVLILALVIFRSFLQNKKKNKLIKEQKHLVEEKQREIIDSIRYAQRIQKALMPSEKYFEKNINKLQIKN